jgi:hypothetical protein
MRRVREDRRTAAAMMLGDAARVRAEMERDPRAATRPDPRTGWTPLHGACASRWYYLDPARAPGLLATARCWMPARTRTAAPAVPRLVAAALRDGLGEHRHGQRGDHPAAAGSRCHSRGLRSLPGWVQQRRSMLPAAAARPRPSRGGGRRACAGGPGRKDVEGARLMLAAGADPRRCAADDGRSAVYAAVQADCPAELLELLLSHGADPVGGARRPLTVPAGYQPGPRSSRPATPSWTAPRWRGPSSAAANGPGPVLGRIGPRPRGSCSMPVPSPTASSCQPTTARHQARRSRTYCGKRECGTETPPPVLFSEC